MTLPSRGLGCSLTHLGENERFIGHPRSRGLLSHALSRIAAIFDYMSLFGFRDVIGAIAGPILLLRNILILFLTLFLLNSLIWQDSNFLHTG